MRSECMWILFLILPSKLVWTWPVQVQQDNLDYSGPNGDSLLENNAGNMSEDNVVSQENDQQVISVRITSSVAVERGKTKKDKLYEVKQIKSESPTTVTVIPESTITTIVTEINKPSDAEFPGATSELSGANLEFIKQLQTKKEGRLHNYESNYPVDSSHQKMNFNEHEDSVAESSVTSIVHYNDQENEENVPLARSLPFSPSPKNYFHSQSQKQLRGRSNSPILTTVSHNIVHDTPRVTQNYDKSYLYFGNNQTTTSTLKYYESPKIYNEPAKIYSEPAKVYSEPAKIYSEPAKIYSEPAKIYSEPAKVYSEPAKIYSEPAKFYSEPASLHLPVESAPSLPPWMAPVENTGSTMVQIHSTPTTTLSELPPISSTERDKEHPEKNYEVDEKVSVMTDGRSHGVQDHEEHSNIESCKQENCKVGYVVEGRQYRKYRVEEKTSDGFIVGEYGVVRNEDGALRGVRYTADSAASPRLIYDALMKFLQLK